MDGEKIISDVVPTGRRVGDRGLAKRLSKAVEGEVLFDRFSRGRYSTDASIYQVEPIGVVIPKTEADIEATIAIAREEGVPVLPRGAGTSQCGQTVAEAVVIDCSKHFNKVIELNPEGQQVRVRPGIVLDTLNRHLKPHGLFFPIDPSTASRATIGGMAANNSCGARSIRYGNMVHNVDAIDAIMASGKKWRFDNIPQGLDKIGGGAGYRQLVEKLRAIAVREADELEANWPKVLRRVGGYNIDSLSTQGHNMAQMLVGSEGTLAFFTALDLKLQQIPKHRVLGVCQFPTFHSAMEVTRRIVELDPASVEVIDSTMIELALDIPVFRATMEKVLIGRPDALLLVEFSGDELAPLEASLKDLEVLMADSGFPRLTVPIADPSYQAAVWEVRKSALNIMMSMKGDGKPVSFIEDCAVPLEHLAEYTARLTEVFEKHGTKGTWYAHASVGCLHVRPILNMKEDGDVRKMRAIAEEAFAMVKAYKGSHSGEHGDGIARSEFHEYMFGPRLVRALEEIKDAFDPAGLFNPHRVGHPPKMDDRRLFRFRPDYAAIPIDTAFDWSDWGGMLGAVEMCNNNGECRKADASVMCPSFRATGDEIHLTRGRANSLRLALTGQLGPDAFSSDDMKAAMDLCVSCKGCKRECPTGVDMARMKYEFLAHWRQRNPMTPRDRLIAGLPHYAPFASKFALLLNLRNWVPAMRWLGEKLFGLAAERQLPEWHRRPFRPAYQDSNPAETDVVLFTDTFNTWFEPDNAHAALRVLNNAGYRVALAQAGAKQRPLCCGRTWLAAGLVDQARAEARRTIAALKPFADAGVPIVGLEPSCLFSFRDEYPVLLPNGEGDALAGSAMLFEEFLAAEHAAGRLDLSFKPAANGENVLLHGHCHQKAFDVMGSVETVLRLVPSLSVTTISTSCCGMAGSFGYEAEHIAISKAMAEADLLPAVRAAEDDTIIVADGTSCRHQIADGTERSAIHVARVLADRLA
jgi:FAD/FMN-containing dehydrogenase/Fe-S oxidoreductase